MPACGDSFSLLNFQYSPFAGAVQDGEFGPQALPPSNTAAAHSSPSTDTRTARESFEDLFSYGLPALICSKLVLEDAGADAAPEKPDTDMTVSEEPRSTSPHGLSRPK